MPLRAVVSPEQLAVEARALPLLASAQTLAEWVGAGREVTARGVLKPAAAVEVCDRLGIEAPSRKPRSALDIHELMTVWGTAYAAGFIEVSGSRVMAGPALEPWSAGTPDTVLAVWSTCALESLGLVEETDEEDLEYLALLIILHDHGGAVALGDLSAGVAQLTDDDSTDCSCADCAPQPHYPDDLGSEVDTEDAVQVLAKLGIAVLRHDVVELTLLGHWLTDFMFRQSAPPADADATALVRELAPLPAMVIMPMARPWLSARSPAAAARELLAVGESTSGQERLAALTVARECGSAAAPAWQEWAAKDGFGAYARVSLAELADTEPADADWAWITVDTLVIVLHALPPDLPEDLLFAQLRAQAGDDMTEVLPMMASSGHPAAPELVKLLTRRPVTADRGVGYEIKVQLSGATNPPVWRRLQIPADLGLDQFHAVVQAAMGWEDCHLYKFSDGRRQYDERKVRLSQVLTSVGDQISYTYDFGDRWEHDIVLEQVLSADAAVTGPVCVAGSGACPPEDCGGVWSYEKLKATLADAGSERHIDILEWLGLDSGDDFDPGEFSVAKINRRLGHSG